jgi:hypothetical protein
MSDQVVDQIEYLRTRPIDEALTVIRHNKGQCEYQQSEIDRLKKIIKRLGSSQAFTLPRMTDKIADKELLARMDYARESI